MSPSALAFSPSVPAPPVSRPAVHVLLVEDSPGDARLVREVLRETGAPFRVTHVERLREAREVLSRGGVDLVLLDLSLPDSHGLDTVAAAQRAAPHVPVLVLTGNSDEELAARALHVGAQDYLVKGEFDAPLLLRAIRYATERKRAADRTVRLQAITAALSQALTPEQVAEVAVLQAMGALGAYRAIVAVLSEDGEEFTVLRTVGYPDRVVEAVTRFPAGVRAPVCDAVRAGRALLLGSPDEIRRRYGHLLGPLEEEETGAWAVVPMWADGRVVGGFGLSFREPQAFHEEDRSFLESIATQCGQALERARLYAEAERARSSAEAATRVRDEVLGIVAHDLRNPLSAIQMTAYVIQEEGCTDECRRDRAGVICELTQRMDRLIRDLLDASAIRAGGLSVRPEPLPARMLLDEARDVAEASAHPRGHVVVVEAPASLPLVLADHDRVLQVFSNLAGNAAKFTPERGRITLCAEAVEGAVRFSVSDTGTGIPEDVQARVFDRFWQADRDRTGRHGAGLGLAICKGIVEAHGGSVGVVSRPGEGSTFHFTLPVAEAPPRE
jgi:signal transduction histidine kinase